VLIKVVQALLAAAPESAQTADVYGRLPLHYAVDKASVDMDVVECLLSAFPAG
jgi:ankyrin repeat protein